MGLSSVDRGFLMWFLVTVVIPLFLPFILIWTWDCCVLHIGLSLEDIVNRLFEYGIYTLFGVMLFVSLIPEHTKFANQALTPLLLYYLSFIFVLIYSGNIFVRDVGMTDKVTSYFGYDDNIMVTKITLLICICLAAGYKYWSLWQDETDMLKL